MGITIHYKGKLDNSDFADCIIHELTDISSEIGWKYDLINDEKKQFKGIVINPHPNSEPLTFLFDKNGTLKNLFALRTDSINKIDYSYLSTKTQFAPIEAHITIIKLLKYLKKKYISNLDVYDEARYWETEDNELLQSKISFLNKKMDEIQGILSEIEPDENDTIDKLIDKIEKILLHKFKDRGTLNPN